MASLPVQSNLKRTNVSFSKFMPAVKENVKEYYLVVNYPCKITIQVKNLQEYYLGSESIAFTANDNYSSESEYSLAQLAHANRSCSASIYERNIMNNYY